MVVKKKTKKKKVTKKTAKKTTKKVAKKTSKKVTKAKKVAKKTTKKVARKVAKKVARKSLSKISQKKSKKGAKKSSKKQVKKTTVSKARTTNSSPAVPTSKPSQKLKGKEGTVAAKKKDAQKNTLKDVLNFLRGFDFLASDSDDCSERKCDNPATTGAYCRLHYIKNWKEIKKKEQIFSKGTLIQYIEELIDKFSINTVNIMVNDMSNEKHFYNALKNMNIDVAGDFFDDTDDSSDESDIPFPAKNRTSLCDDE